MLLKWQACADNALSGLVEILVTHASAVGGAAPRALEGLAAGPAVPAGRVGGGAEPQEVAGASAAGAARSAGRGRCG